MSRYFISFVITSLLYLPLLYLLFFYKTKEKEPLKYLPLKISNFQTKPPTPTGVKSSVKKKKSPSKLPKKLYPTNKNALEKILPKVAQEQKNSSTGKKQKQKDRNETLFITVNPLTTSELNSLFQPKPKEKLQEEKKLKDLYKEEYDSLSPQEKEYLNKNISTIGAITQKYLKFPYLARRLQMSGKNMVEFYIAPNGDISELKLVDSSGYSLLDDNSLDTIKLAHKEYPYPKEKTRVRIYVDYILN